MFFGGKDDSLLGDNTLVMFGVPMEDPVLLMA